MNITYQRYIFYQRVQDTGERFDAFLGDVRRLAKSSKFEGVEESMIRDPIVVGVRVDATRRKLLQIRDDRHLHGKRSRGPAAEGDVSIRAR